MVLHRDNAGQEDRKDKECSMLLLSEPGPWGTRPWLVQAPSKHRSVWRIWRHSRAFLWFFSQPPFLQAACTELQVRPASCIPHGCPRRTTVIISPTTSAQPAPRRHGAGRGHTSVAPLHGLAIDKDIPHMWSPRLAPDHATGYTALLGNSLCFCPLSFLISC